MLCLLVKGENNHIKGMNVMGRRYRRRSNASQIISDSVVIGSRLPWYGALLFGLISFFIFYYVVPHWFFQTHIEEAGSHVSVGAEALNARGVRLGHYLGIATGAIGLFFSIRNYFCMGMPERSHRGIVAFLARMLGRELD